MKAKPRTRLRPNAGRAAPISPLDFMRLIWAVDHQMERVSKRMETRIGLTIPQRMSLLLIGRDEDIGARELAQLLHLHPGTVSGIVGRLESAGLVIRTGDAADARRWRLTLSRKGRKVNQRRAGTFEAATRRAMAAVSAQQVAAAAHVLERLATELGVSCGVGQTTR